MGAVATHNASWTTISKCTFSYEIYSSPTVLILLSHGVSVDFFF